MTPVESFSLSCLAVAAVLAVALWQYGRSERAWWARRNARRAARERQRRIDEAVRWLTGGGQDEG